MNKQDLSSYLETIIDINLPDFILNLLMVGFMFVNSNILQKFSTTLSNRRIFKRFYPLRYRNVYSYYNIKTHLHYL